MKIRKILVTEKNIHALAGRIQKFFDSIKECGAYDYTTTHWSKRTGNTHYFNEGECSIVETREVGFFDDRLNYHEVPETNYSIKLRIINPCGYDIKIGDYIHLGGNHFIHSIDDKYYMMYERNIIKPLTSLNIAEDFDQYDNWKVGKNGNIIFY